MASAHLLTAMRCTSTRFRSSNPFCVRSVGRRAYLVPQTCSFEVTMLWELQTHLWKSGEPFRSFVRNPGCPVLGV